MRGRLTYANVMSTLAVVIAIGGGTAFAAIEWGKNSVRSRHIAPGAVKAPDIGRNAVKRGKIAPGAVNAARLANGSVNANKLAAGAVATAKLAGEAVEEPKLAPNLRTKVNALQRGGLLRVDADPGTQAQATEHTLLTRGPFRIYAKCWTSGQNVTGQAYLSSSQPGALASGSLTTYHGGLGSTYLEPGLPESQRRFATSSTINSPNVAGIISGAATLVHGSTSIQVGVSGFLKGSTVSADASNYGAGGARCLFSSYLIAASG